jgi:peroxiredoxin
MAIHTFRNALLIMAFGLFSLTVRADLDTGDDAPRLDIELIDGRTLAAGALDGKVVVYMFWATWCPICVGELPDYQKLYSAYSARGLEIAALSLDEDAGKVAKFWNGNGYTFPVAMRSDAARYGFGNIKGTPTTFIVDRKGKVAYKHLGGMPDGELEKWIKALL